MKICSIDSTLNEEVSANDISKLIESSLLRIKVQTIKNHFWKKGLNRKTLERSHILFITQPRKRLTKEDYIELVSYIDIGGNLILTYSDYQGISLGHWFKNMREELGIELHETVYGIPKVSEETRLIGTQVKMHKAQTIALNNDPKFLRFHGIKKYIPILKLDKSIVAVAAYKRRGTFIVFSSPEIFQPENRVFLNKLLYIVLNRLSFELEEKIPIKKIGNSDYYFSLHYACFDDYVISLYHHNFKFAKKVFSINSQLIEDWLISTISEIKAEGTKPTRQEILETAQVIKSLGEKNNAYPKDSNN